MADFFQTQELISDFEPAFGPALFDRSLLIVGVGGNGTHIALAAVRMGFQAVVGIDCDLVSASNLSRQVLYTRQDVGRRKASVAAESLQHHNLRSAIQMHDFDILQYRPMFGALVASADLVFVVLDQPGPTFFAVDASYRLGKPAVSGGTCVLSGLSTRIGWMWPSRGACLNCAFPAHPRLNDWIGFHRYEDGAAKKRTPEVEKADEELSLAGGHPSTYPAACLGANLMVAAALQLLMGRFDFPQELELALPGLVMDRRELRKRQSCPTCGVDG